MFLISFSISIEYLEVQWIHKLQGEITFLKKFLLDGHIICRCSRIQISVIKKTRFSFIQ